MTEARDLAEDCVLGPLDAAEAGAVAARLAAPPTDEDRALGAAVGAAQDALLALDPTAPEMALASDAWERLQGALPARRPPAAPAPLAARRERRDRWRTAALGTMAASVLLGVASVWRIVADPSPAALMGDGDSVVAVVEAYVGDSVRVVPLQAAEADPEQVFQVWPKPDPEEPPVSLGVVEALQRAEITGPDLPEPAQDQLYGITIEPAGGSPTGLPTGPIVGRGLAQTPL